MEVTGRRLDKAVIFCEPCEVENSKSPADGACRECKEYMCNTCFRHHLKSKHSRKHVLLSLDDFSSLVLNSGSEDVIKCEKHDNENVKFFCRSHDVVGCGDCLVLEHTSCNKPEYIKDLAKTFIDGEMYKAIIKRVEDLVDKKIEYGKEIENSKDKLEMMNKNALKEIRLFRSEINKCLDDAEANILSKLQELTHGNTKTQTKIEKQLQALTSELGKVKQLLNTQLHHENALFINAINCKSKLFDIEKIFENKEQYGMLKHFTFVRNEKMSGLLKIVEPLGNLRIEANDNKAEATFSYTVENISKLKEKMLSPKCMVQNLPWRISAMQRISQTVDKRNQKSLGFYLQCNAESHSTSWSCNAAAELRIINQKKKGEDFVRKIQHLFSSKENDWGYSNFIPLDELRDPVKGFCKDDKVILQVHVIADVPQDVINLEAPMLQESKEADVYKNVQIVTEDYFYGHQGTDLFDLEKANFRNIRVKKSATLKEFIETLAENLNYQVQQIRPWPFQARQNQTYRATLLDIDAELNKTVQDLAEEGAWTVFVETTDPESNDRRLPHFDKDSDVLLFLKMYDPRTKSVKYCGHAYVPIAAKRSELLLELNRRARFPTTTPLILFEEIKPNMLEMLPSTDLPVEKMVEELMDGDIIVFQKDERDLEQYELPTAKEYFRWQYAK